MIGPLALAEAPVLALALPFLFQTLDVSGLRKMKKCSGPRTSYESFFSSLVHCTMCGTVVSKCMLDPLAFAWKLHRETKSLQATWHGFYEGMLQLPWQFLCARIYQILTCEVMLRPLARAWQLFSTSKLCRM